MQESSPTRIESSQIEIANRLLVLQSQINGGIGWFYWIAGLSLLNSIMFYTGSSISFTIGLGLTQVIDVIVSDIAETVGNSATVVHIAGFALDLLVAGFFVACGFFGRKGKKWLVIVGLVSYILDGVLTLVFSDWLGAAFHCLAIYGIIKGLKAIDKMKVMREDYPVADVIPQTIQAIPVIDAQPYPQKTVQYSAETGKKQSNLGKFTLGVILFAALAVGAVVLFILTYKPH